MAGQRDHTAERGLTVADTMPRARARERHRSTRGRHLTSRRRDSRGTRFARFARIRAPVAAAGLAAGHLILSLLTFQPQPHTGGDNAAYLSLATALLERHEYVTLYDPAAPAHTQYPPVFPAVLAAAMAAGLEPWAPLKVLLSIFSAIAVAFTYLWMRRRRRPALGLGITALVAISPGVLEQGHWILSDVPFWCFTMVALWAFERLPPERRLVYGIAVTAAVLAYFTRSAGLPLALAAAVWLLLRKRWRQLAGFAAVLLPLALLWWLRARQHGGIDYVGQFWLINPYAPELGPIGAMDLFDRMIDNGSRYARIHLPILLTGAAGTFALVASLAVSAAALFGWMRRVRRPGVAELFLPLYVGLLLIWPAVWSGERFLLPALPVVLFYAGDGLVRAGNLVRRRAGFAASMIAAGLVGVLALPQLMRAAAASGPCMIEYRAGNRYACLPPAWRDFFGVAEWARTALPADAAVISRKPSLFWVISGLPSRMYPLTPDPTALLGMAGEIGARYIVLDHLDGLSQAYLGPAIVQRPEAFCLVYRSALDGTAVLGVLDDIPEPAADAAASQSIAIEACGPGWLRATGPAAGPGD